MKLIYSFIGSLVLVLFLSCSGDKTNEKNEGEHKGEHADVIELSEEQMNIVGIKIGVLEQRNLNNVIRVNGVLKVIPQDRADVSSLVSGIVRKILVTEGSRVKRGQVVAMIENTDIVEMQKNYMTSVRQCQAARTDYERQKGLSHSGAGVKKTLQQAYSAYEIAKVEMKGIARQLRQLSVNPENVANGRFTMQVPVYAPISGVVNNISASIGSFTDMQKPLMQLSNTSGIYCDMKVYEKDLYSVKVGYRVDLMLTNHPDVKLTGVVAKINGAFDAQSRTVSVFVRLVDRGDILLIPDMYVTGLINSGRVSTPAVPDDAVVMMDNVPYIFSLVRTTTENSKKMYHFKKEKVVTGVTELGYTQINLLTPLPANAKVVTSNAFYLSSMISEHGEHAH